MCTSLHTSLEAESYVAEGELIIIIIIILKVPNWRTLAQDRRRWKELVEKAKTLH
jgi:hypothetical protein